MLERYPVLRYISISLKVLGVLLFIYGLFNGFKFEPGFWGWVQSTMRGLLKAVLTYGVGEFFSLGLGVEKNQREMLDLMRRSKEKE